MTSINKEPVKLEFGGKVYQIKPSFRVIDNIEQRIGLAVIANRLQSGDVRVGDLAWIIHSALVSSGVSALDYDACGDLILGEKGGIAKASLFASRLVEAALSPSPQEPIESEEADGAVAGTGKA